MSAGGMKYGLVVFGIRSRTPRWYKTTQVFRVNAAVFIKKVSENESVVGGQNPKEVFELIHVFARLYSSK
jgi:hypothetical protein